MHTDQYGPVGRRAVNMSLLWLAHGKASSPLPSTFSIPATKDTCDNYDWEYEDL